MREIFWFCEERTESSRLGNVRHPEILANDLVMWESEAGHGEIKRGRPKQSYLNTLLRDVGINS